MFDLVKLLKLDTIIDSLMGYLETKVEYYKIQLKEEIAKAMALLVFILILSFFILLVLILLSFLMVSYFNEVFNSRYVGFLILIGFYLICIILLMVFRKRWIYDEVLKAVFRETPIEEKKQA